MVILLSPWEWKMQLLQRVGNNSIFHFLVCTAVFGTADMEVRMRAVRVGDYTFISTQQDFYFHTLFTQGFCTQIHKCPCAQNAVLLGLHLGCIMAFVTWSTLHYLQNWTPELIDLQKLPSSEKDIWRFFCSMHAWDRYLFWSSFFLFVLLVFFFCLKLPMLILITDSSKGISRIEQSLGKF